MVMGWDTTTMKWNEHRPMRQMIKWIDSSPIYNLGFEN